MVIGDDLYLIAGWDGASGFLSDVWKLNLRDYSWTEVKVQGETMPQMSRCAV